MRSFLTANGTTGPLLATRPQVRLAAFHDNALTSIDHQRYEAVGTVDICFNDTVGTRTHRAHDPL